jgi:VWFA-related protein
MTRHRHPALAATLAATLATLAALAIAASGAASLDAQQPPGDTPVLRSGVDQVVVDVVVTDSSGATVGGLTAADFEIRERGDRQAIATFAEVALPLRIRGAGAELAAPGDVRSNTQRDGRLYVLVLDDFHIGVDLTALVREAGSEFLRRHVQPGDLVAVTTTTGLGGTRRELTPDLARANAAIQAFIGRRGAVGLAAPQGRSQAAATGRNSDRMAARQTSAFAGEDPSEDTTAETVDRARTSFATLQSAADALAGVPGRRKTVLFFSEGIAIPPRDDHGLQDGLQTVVAAAARANVAIYAIDPRGLSHLDPNGLVGTGAEVNAALLANHRHRILTAAMLREVAERTGGAAALDRNDTLTPLARIAEESSHYYLLGYTPTDGRRDGRFRAIDVRVSRPGLRVAARKGYLAPNDRKDTRQPLAVAGRLAELIRRPVPTAGLSLVAQAVAYPSGAGNVAVILEVAPASQPAAGAGAERIVDIVIQPVDSGGRTVPAFEAHVALPPPENAATPGARIVQRLTLPPGDYQLRIAARDRAGAAEGAVICEVVVVDPKAQGLALTGVVVGSARGGRLPSATIDASLTRGLGGIPPTLARSFAQNETLSAYAEVIDAGVAAARDVALLTIIRDAAGRDVVRSPQPRANARVAAGEPFAYAVDLPLKALAPGRYVLRVEALATGAAAPVVREVPFEVTAAMP